VDEQTQAEAVRTELEAEETAGEAPPGDRGQREGRRIHQPRHWPLTVAGGRTSGAPGDEPDRKESRWDEQTTSEARVHDDLEPDEDMASPEADLGDAERTKGEGFVSQAADL
jgi:hypothetical protein